MLKFANNIYNLYRFDIGCSNNIGIEDFYKAKFFCDKQKQEYICKLLYRRHG